MNVISKYANPSRVSNDTLASAVRAAQRGHAPGLLANVMQPDDGATDLSCSLRAPLCPFGAYRCGALLLDQVDGESQ